MDHRKRILAFMLSGVMLLSLGGCGVDYEKQDELKAAGIKKLESNEPEKALENFEEAIRLAGTSVTESEVDLCYYKGTAQIMMGEYDDAIETFDGILTYDEKDEKAYFLRACTKIKAGDAGGAAADFQKTFDLTGECDALFYGFTSLMTEGYKVEAMEFYDSTKASMDDAKRLLYEQIVIYEENGEFDKAREAASKYLSGESGDKAVGREYDFLSMLK